MRCVEPIRRLHVWFKQELVAIIACWNLLLICIEISLWKHHTMCELDTVCSNASGAVEQDCSNLNSLSSFLFSVYSVQVGVQISKVILNLQLNHVYSHMQFKQVTTAEVVRAGWNLVSDTPIVLLLLVRVVVMPFKSLGYHNSLPRLPGNFIVVLLLLFSGCLTIIVDLAKLTIAISKHKQR